MGDLDVDLTSDKESRSGSTIPRDDDSHDDNNDDDVDVDDKRKTQIIKPKVDSSSAPILERNDEDAAGEEGERSLSLVDKAISLELLLLKQEEEKKHKTEEEMIYNFDDISSELMLLLTKEEHTQKEEKMKNR